jgi:uncharacterized protein (TIGR00251 family)
MKDVEKLSLREAPGGVIIPVKVVPGSSRDRLVGVLGDSLKIATSAAPEKGKANAAVAKILADALGIDARRVELVSGPTSPRKEFRIVGTTAEAVRMSLDKT